MNVRSFQLSDCSIVTKLLGEVLSETCYTDTMDAFAKQLSLDSSLVLVAEESDQIVGVIIGTIDNNEGYYYRIAVDRSNQRKGIGKKMIQSMKKRFEQRKVKKIMVTVDAHNEPILSLYESMGYRAQDFSHSIQKLRIMNG
jgi:ribosomal protein S18 acetylase RimI-like enzyme